MAKTFNIAVMPGDGIGSDITKPSVDFISDIAKAFERPGTPISSLYVGRSD